MVSILLMSVGITFIIIGILVFIDKIKMLKYGIKVKGEVIGFEKDTSAYIDQNKRIAYISVYKPKIKFFTSNGEMKIITYNTSDIDKAYNIGDKIDLVYTENEPDYLEIANGNAIFSILCKIISVGIVFVIFSVILWIV
ncbi:DUF3592 domain-containing protein [uncultured Clostridium sp.]|uniref:DUF3592 domain-containing protein n=1 Tax=uncultured Clostridium sp. TaxID=59620 RepID=UPI0025F45FB1|nr:DUF3592 domain-containing protein [uncultured Clostridium sp.]